MMGREEKGMGLENLGKISCVRFWRLYTESIVIANQADKVTKVIMD